MRHYEEFTNLRDRERENMESKVLQCKICIRILSDPDPNPNPNGLIGFGFEFGSLKTFGSFRIRIWIRIRIPNSVFNNGAKNLRRKEQIYCIKSVQCAISASEGGFRAPLVQAQEDSVRH